MDTRLLTPDAHPDLPIHQLTFEAWVGACWAANRYRDAYIEDFGFEDAPYAAVSAGGCADDARNAYSRLLFQQPRNAQMALAAYDELPADLQTLAQAHFESLTLDLQWREAVERTLAEGCRLWVPRAPLRSITRQPALTLYRSASELDFPLGSTASLPYRRPGGEHNARASGRVVQRDGHLWIEARTPGSACTHADLHLIAAPYAVLKPGGRPEKPDSAPVAAFPAHEFFEVDERPQSVYYVTARQDSGGSALLLGPFGTHLEALAQTAVASAYVHQKARTSLPFAVSIGTGRLDLESARATPGRLNATLLDHELLSRVQQLLGTHSRGHVAATA